MREATVPSVRFSTVPSNYMNSLGLPVPLLHMHTPLPIGRRAHARMRAMREAAMMIMTTKFTSVLRGAAMRFRAGTGYGWLVVILLAAPFAECQGGDACMQVPCMVCGL